MPSKPSSRPPLSLSLTPNLLATLAPLAIVWSKLPAKPSATFFATTSPSIFKLPLASVVRPVPVLTDTLPLASLVSPAPVLTSMPSKPSSKPPFVFSLTPNLLATLAPLAIVWSKLSSVKALPAFGTSMVVPSGNVKTTPLSPATALTYGKTASLSLPFCDHVNLFVVASNAKSLTNGVANLVSLPVPSTTTILPSSTFTSETTSIVPFSISSFTISAKAEQRTSLVPFGNSAPSQSFSPACSLPSSISLLIRFSTCSFVKPADVPQPLHAILTPYGFCLIALAINVIAPRIDNVIG